MVMMNTWGDRAQDTKVTESFCLNEIRLAAKMGITHFQIDDGWQEGKSANSAYGGSFKNIWSNPDYWTPSKSKYPEGLGKVSKEAKERGVELCLWFNPSAQENYADWQKDAEAMNKLYDSYGIRTFKIDGLHIPNHQSQEKSARYSMQFSPIQTTRLYLMSTPRPAAAEDTFSSPNTAIFSSKTDIPTGKTTIRIGLSETFGCSQNMSLPNASR